MPLNNQEVVRPYFTPAGSSSPPSSSSSAGNAASSSNICLVMRDFCRLPQPTGIFFSSLGLSVILEREMVPLSSSGRGVMGGSTSAPNGVERRDSVEEER